MILNSKELELYRQQKNERDGLLNHTGGTKVTLYGVISDLSHPVIKFDRLSKRALYSVDGEIIYKYTTNNNITVCTSGAEAWNHYRKKIKEREKKLKRFIAHEKFVLEKANNILKENFEKYPEYFL
jgi:hypothetical protein